ncbi:O-antigen/teichoic acid export membrane protein [Microbacterium sp. W4I4]|uniref:hypothetical protein n=1 Tax=Microbacterium sp. W4I4 TaxID=3042295 RepID=UPI00277D4C92|nr:hypothetical protein [Microbacterium sp. W4I4]MDQ0613030.1 O-antigen/teichoic acid export membrane protein [Microbacterium sp. W4I4]
MSHRTPDHGAPYPGLDPTKVTSQPALRTSSGAIWLVASTVFTAVCLIPLIGIIVTDGAAAIVALIAVVVLLCLLAAMFIIRFQAEPGPRRLRWLAACMLAMAVVALTAMVICVAIVWGSVPR